MTRLSFLSALILGIQFIFFIPRVFSQDAPLFVQGALEDATVTDDTYNTGGTIIVNGFSIQIPKNMLVQFPAAWVPWKDFVAQKDSMIGYETNVCIIHYCSLLSYKYLLLIHTGYRKFSQWQTYSSSSSHLRVLRGAS